MRANTRIRVEAPASKSKPLVVRIFGALSEVFVKAKGPTEIRTAAGTAAVRGTQYLVRLDAENQTTVTVSEGTVAFFNPQGEVLVAAGQQSSATVGTAPTPPVAVDVSGLIAWTSEVAGLPLEIEIPFETTNPTQIAANLQAAKLRLARTPGDDNAQIVLARALYDSGQFGAAAEIFRAQNADFPLGRALLAAGDSQGAIAAFEKAGEGEPKIWLALALLNANREDEARNLLGGFADYPLARVGLGLADLRVGKYGQSEAHLRVALQKQPDFYQAQSLLALALLQQNRLAQAEQTARLAAQNQPFSAQTQATLAYTLFFAGKNPEARKIAQKSLDLNPLSPFALLTAGRAELAAQNVDEAKNLYQQAAVLAPEMSFVNRELGAVYARLDSLPKAEAAYRVALEQNPNDGPALAGLGTVLNRRGQTEDAKTAFQNALTNAPKDANVRAQYAAFLVEIGDLETARKQIEGLEKTGGPELGALYIRLSEEALFRQNLNQALEFARQAVKVLPASALAHYQLGRVYLEQERVTQAQSQFRQAATLDPQLARARYALGLTQELAATGRDPSSALGQIAAAIESSPQQATNIQNLQTPGATERIKAAIQDPTVVRTATRSFGDTQLDGALGTNGTQNLGVSYLSETANRRGVQGFSFSRDATDGIRANADSTNWRGGFVLGRKQSDSPSGFFLLGQYDKREYGTDNEVFSNPQSAITRSEVKKPSLIAGYNLQNSENARTRFLIGADQTKSDFTIPPGFQHNDFDSLHFEVRHDQKIGDRHYFSAGIAAGRRKVKNDGFVFVPPPPPPLPPIAMSLTNQGDRTVNAEAIYLRDEWKATPKLTLTGELKGRRLRDDLMFQGTISPPPPPPPPPLPPFPATINNNSNRKGFKGLPTLVAEYQIAPSTGIRFRARRLSGSIEDFELLSPTDVFLFSESQAPDVPFFVKSRRYELELDHTFSDASFVRLGAFQQSSGQSNNTAGEILTSSRFRGFRAGYEGVLNPQTTFFLNADYNQTRGVVTDFITVSPNEALSDVPKVRLEAGLQFLSNNGYFVQPSAGYIGSRFRPTDFVNPRMESGGFTVANLRLGKRWGLKSVAFVEVSNLFDKSYSIFVDGPEVLNPGRQYRVGISQRF